MKINIVVVGFIMSLLLVGCSNEETNTAPQQDNRQEIIESNTFPENISKDFYEDAVFSYKEIMLAAEERRESIERVANWAWEHTLNVESNPEQYTEEEAWIISGLGAMIAECAGATLAHNRGVEFDYTKFYANSRQVAQILGLKEFY